jgi:pyruvate dehydrogenase E2 component (dihydrolipoamide acetyltransferase)
MAEFRMPSLGADMEKGTLLEWKAKPGDAVKRGDIIAVVATEKADFDVECYEIGTFEKILVQPGETVPVGTPLAFIRAMGERDERIVPSPAATVVPPGAPPRMHVSPLARRTARERGIDLNQVRPASPDSVIHRADVERAARVSQEEPQRPSPPVARTHEGVRRAIAAAMSRSNSEIPHYYLETPVNLKRAIEWLQAENLKRPIQQRILPVALLVKGVARALGDVPALNGYWINGEPQVKDSINIGFAVSLRSGGLINPAVLDADLKSLDEMMTSIRDLITRARAGRLRGAEMTESTITVTSLGDLGVETVYGVIYPPQVALVGFGRISDRPWAEGGMLGVCPVVTATLSGDHRATDGHLGAQFLDALNRYLQEPEKL